MIKKLCIYMAVSALSYGCVYAQEQERKVAFDNYHRYYTDGQKVKDADKEKAIRNFREQYAATPYRPHSLNTCTLTWQDCLAQLGPNGQFEDMAATEQAYREKQLFRTANGDAQQKVGEFLAEACNRLWKMAEAYRTGEASGKKILSEAYMKAILHYGGLELERRNDGPRFHSSCFAIPTATVNIYYCFLNQMEKVEADKEKNLMLKETCDMLKSVSLQAWTQPFRNDETDQNVVQIERFRKHVWWVGGNALAYRSLLPVAVMYRSIPMIDLLSDVAQKGISMTSQQTYDDAFWTEGFTADGAGWGHGMQCLVWGYPIDGTSNALAMLTALKGSPWAKKLSRDNADAILNFLRGGNWYYFNGYTPPCLDRGSMQYDVEAKKVRYVNMLITLVNEWITSFTPEEQMELRQLRMEANDTALNMAKYEPGMYNGTRWFFNNDDLIKKNKRYHILVNMASVRCDGVESAPGFADAYNFYPTDGMMMFSKTGNEYRKVMGAWDVTAAPGVTAREGMDRLTPVTNWRGYCSKHNFAAGATSGGENAVAGFIYEKMDASTKEGVNDIGKKTDVNAALYGVKAYKSYFMMGDYTVALGAGVTNLTPNEAGTIRTSIDQTSLDGDILAMQGGKTIPVGNGQWSFFVNGKPVWAIQKGKFAYTILPEYTKAAYFVYETKKADWVKMNSANKTKKDLPETVNIFRLWVDHGNAPVNDTYGYVVYAGDGMPATDFPFQVLRNDTVIQAMRSGDQNVVEAVFYQSGSVLKAEGIELSASAPCAVLIEKGGKGTQLTVTDAEMDANRKEITVTYNGKPIVVTMPQGMLCGKPATVAIN